MSNEKEWVGSAMNYDKACLIYEAKGPSGVIDAAKDGTLKVDHWGYCVPCEAHSPIEDGCCLVCGTQYEEGQEPEEEQEPKEPMSLQEALNVAIHAMSQSLDELKQMSDYEKMFLKISDADLIEAIRVLDEHMRTM